MKKVVNKRLKYREIFFISTILLGTVLLIYMVVVEDEPGALPLLLIIIGIVGLIINRLNKNIRKPK